MQRKTSAPIVPTNRINWWNYFFPGIKKIHMTATDNGLQFLVLCGRLTTFLAASPHTHRQLHCQAVVRAHFRCECVPPHWHHVILDGSSLQRSRGNSAWGTELIVLPHTQLECPLLSARGAQAWSPPPSCSQKIELYFSTTEEKIKYLHYFSLRTVILKIFCGKMHII